MRNWAEDTVDLDYLADSGILFKINQTVSHLFGIGFGLSVDSAGKKCLAFVDCRKTPEDLVFTEANFELGEGKYQRFREAFGGSQIMRRQEKLGCACQNYPWVRR